MLLKHFVRLSFPVIVLLLISCYVKREINSVLNFRSMGYNVNNAFIYRVTEKGKNGICLKRDTAGVFYPDIIMPQSDSLYLEKWYFVTRKGDGYDVDFDRGGGFGQGTKVADSELFMHPPRFDYFKILQFCPYPYFKLMNRANNTWRWRFNVGGQWAIDSLYPVGDKDVEITTDYTFVGTATIPTVMGNLFCYKVIATSDFSFGKSIASFLLSPSHGLVRYSATTTNNLQFELDLIARGPIDTILDSTSTYLKWENRQKIEQKNNIGWY